MYFAAIENGHFSVLVPLMEVNSFITGKRGVSLPFTDSCEPLINSLVDFNELFEQIKGEGKKRDWQYVELRGGDGFLGTVPANLTYFGHALSLEKGEKEVMANFRNSTKRNMKKSLQAGVKISIERNPEAMMAYHQLHRLTRKRHGLPPQPYKFFESVFKQVVGRSQGIVILASYEQKVIAGAVFLFMGDKIIYKFGASDLKYQELRANNLVMGEAVRWACREGFRHFDFGRSEPKNQGLRQFKDGWGTREKEIKYYRYDLKKGAFVGPSKSAFTRMANQIFDRLPEPVLNLLGRVFYKHMG